MWGSFLDRGKELAAQAKRAAEELDKHLNESVGVVSNEGGADTQSTETITVDNDVLNDAWDEDEIVDEVNENEMTDAAPVSESEGQNEEVGEEEKIKATVPVAAATEEFADELAPEVPPPHSSQEGWDGDEEVELDDVDISTAHDVNILSATDSTVDQSDGIASPVAEAPLQNQMESYTTADNDSSPEEPAYSTSSAPLLGSIFGNIATLVKQPLSAQVTHESEPILDMGEGPAGEPESKVDLADLEEHIETVPLTKADWSDPSELSPSATIQHTQNGQVEDEEGATATTAVDDAQMPTPPTPASQVPVGDDSHVSSEYVREMEAKLEELQHCLKQRETQLLSKTEQLSIIEKMHETEKEELVLKVQSTKEEAKRRIQKAKERVDAAELQLKNVTASKSSTAEDAQKQAEIVAALRAEGEKLARKQADMEAAVRAAKGEARELLGKLEESESAKDKALVKIATLEADLKSTKDDLSSARLGESQAGKLDMDLRNVREESEKRATTILNLEQEIKELKSTQKELRTELAATRKGAAVETEQERKKLIAEHNHLVSDLEAKLRNQERDAGIREDALRQEVDELRKRWQDAVRRADSLSVDVQSSTAPLLRQLESTNKQNRARAAAWAELETQLRTELEESVILSEKLTKERGELKTKCTRLERSNKDNETELRQLKGELHDKTERVTKLEHQLAEMETEGAKMKAEWAEVERLANEGVSRVRSEMTRTVVDAEERYRTQLDSFENQLRVEREQRAQLEKQVQGLLQNAGVFVPSDSGAQPLPVLKEATPKKLRNSQGQAEILVGALGGLGSADDDEQSDGDEDENDIHASGTSSFAALEQLTSSLKATKVEVVSLRSRLSESERTREDLVQVLAESRNAREKLPLYEARVQELTAENRELTQEVMGLREDIADVRELYRGQLNSLLEAQATHGLLVENGHSSNLPSVPNATDKEGNNTVEVTEAAPERTSDDNGVANETPPADEI
jgi:TATA element modulatory factor